MITKKWSLGTNNNCTYAVMTVDGIVLLECGTNKELAEHVIDIHNKVYDDRMRVEKGIHYCEKHGGYGFQSDCLECKE